MQTLTSKKVSNPITAKGGNKALLKKVESQLKQIFHGELCSSNSIFLRVSDKAIHKIALFLSGCETRSASIGIAGETASGKSTIAFDIIETLEAFAQRYNLSNVITRINTDDYYYDRSDMVKKAGSFAEFAKHYDLDVPEALELELMKEHIFTLLDGKNVYLPEYDMSGTAIRHDNVKLATPAKIIISEGLFTLTPKIADAFDFKIYVHVSHDIQKERFYRRAAERNLGAGADEVYNNALSKAQVHIHPTINKADIVLSGEADRSAYKRFVGQILNLVENIYYIKKENKLVELH